MRMLQALRQQIDPISDAGSRCARPSDPAPGRDQGAPRPARSETGRFRAGRKPGGDGGAQPTSKKLYSDTDELLKRAPLARSPGRSDRRKYYGTAACFIHALTVRASGKHSSGPRALDRCLARSAKRPLPPSKRVVFWVHGMNGINAPARWPAPSGFLGLARPDHCALLGAFAAGAPHPRPQSHGGGAKPFSQNSRRLADCGSSSQFPRPQ